MSLDTIRAPGARQVLLRDISHLSTGRSVDRRGLNVSHVDVNVGVNIVTFHLALIHVNFTLYVSCSVHVTLTDTDVTTVTGDVDDTVI